MGITIGSARIDENGNTCGGKPGDQTGKEVSTQAFYVHSKGWIVLRLKDKERARMAAEAMRRACANDNIGYNQARRLDVIIAGTSSKKPTSCDCGTLVRRCLIEAGFDPGNFTTANEMNVLQKTGLFETPFAYTDRTILYEGDILVTKKKGHTVIVTEGSPRDEYSDLLTKEPSSKSQKSEFLARIVPLCQKQASEHDYHLFPSVTIAQAALESGWGTAKKMVAANAMFGVKVGKNAVKFGKAWHGAAYKAGTTEFYDGKNATRITDYFRQYDKIEDSICDYMDMLLHCERYRRAVDCRSPEESIKGIIEGGYATDPEYVSKIMSIVNKNNLTRFDHKGIINEVCPYTIPNDSYRQMIKRGNRGETVKALQWCLNVLINAGLFVDGNFGPATEAAVKDFQKRAGLKVDGICGKNTWSKIRSML